MEIETTKTYKINVRDDDNNKCSKDCPYMSSDCETVFCELDIQTTRKIGVTILKDNNRTEYCKKFFEA